VSVLADLRSDLRAALERDPAARGALEVALTYPGVHAVWGHRVSNRLWRRNHQFAARLLAAAVQRLTSVDIHPAATLGAGLFIDHATGVVIGETAEVGTDVTIYHGVTLGGTSLSHGKRHPTIGDRVTIGAGAKVLGPITVGSDSRIGSNAVVVKDVPSNAVVVGVPGQVIARSAPRPINAPVDLDVAVMPDLVGASLHALLDRVDELETTVKGQLTATGPRPGADGFWEYEDFSI
jgi:serine O-acetyltransferase